MNIYDILRKKRKGQKLNEKEIDFMVKNYYNSNIPDYQMAAFLTSVVINGMDEEEIFYFTKSIVETGVIMNFDDVDGIKIDKHSTGGVGDSVSLIVIPILACLGYKVPKLSGRALGHTGGTIDKLESIPNFRTDLQIDLMKEALRRVGAFICQPLNLAPADKKIYALRDVTANVDSIPLIASSIMSKKIASNADVIILDVKVGNGAFMNDYNEAVELSKTMLNIAKNFNKIASTIITDMNEPLNTHIGNYLEVIAAIDFLKGNYSNYPKLKEVCFTVIKAAKYILENIDTIKEKGRIEEINLNFSDENIKKIIDSGEALGKFKQIVEFQRGDTSVIDDPYKYFNPSVEYSFYSKGEGFISFDTYLIGLASGELGLSRKTLEDKIDNNAGIIMYKRAGDYVKEGEIIMKLFAKDNRSLENSLKILENAISFKKEKFETKAIYSVFI